MKLTAYISLIIVAAFLPSTCAAQRRELSEVEQTAVREYLAVLRSCLLPDGSINMTPRGKDPSSPVWIAPYFGDHVALALLAADSANRNADDVSMVKKWIEWRAARQTPGGFWYDHTGTIAYHRSNAKVDAHDSSAALFLLVLERYRRAGGAVTAEMRTSAKSCLKCIENVSDTDGMTWAKPDYRVKFLMDNIEVLAGLKAGETFFASLDDAEAGLCASHATKIEKRLPAYYAAKDPELFAWSLHPNGVYEGGFKKLYPQGLAQLFGVAFVKPEADVFARVEATFAPETGPAATGAERYLITAARLGGMTEKKWRAQVLRDRSLLEPTTYSYRPALAILGLVEGAEWMIR